MNKTTPFWLARDIHSEEGFDRYFKSEPIHTSISWKYKNGLSGEYIPKAIEKLILPHVNLSKGQKIKILRTVTDDGKVIFERAE